MASLQRTMLIALLFTLTISSSLARREKRNHDDNNGNDNNDDNDIDYIDHDYRYNPIDNDDNDARTDRQRELRDLCTQTKRPKQCRSIIRNEYNRFENTDWRGVAGGVIDLAIAKCNEIHDKLNQYYTDSKNDQLKDKYISCSKNYNDASRKLDLMKRNLDSNDYRNIPVQDDDTTEELKSCMRDFDKDSFDPAHIRNRNKEFRVYVDLVKATVNRLLQDGSTIDHN